MRAHESIKRMRLGGVAAAVAVCLVGLAAPAPAFAADGHPFFRAVAGSWKGKGKVRPVRNKPSERVKCSADYSVTSNGNAIRQNIRCAGTSFHLFGSGRITYDPKSRRLKGSFSSGPGRTTMSGGRGGASSLGLALKHSGYSQLKNTTGYISLRLVGKKKLVVTMSARDTPSGGMRRVMTVTYRR